MNAIHEAVKALGWPYLPGVLLIYEGPKVAGPCDLTPGLEVEVVLPIEGLNAFVVEAPGLGHQYQFPPARFDPSHWRAVPHDLRSLPAGQWFRFLWRPTGVYEARGGGWYSTAGGAEDGGPWCDEPPGSSLVVPVPIAARR